MNKTITIENDRIDILKDGYNIIEKSIHGENIPELLVEVLEFAINELDMNNLTANSVLNELKEQLQ